MLIKTT